MDYINLILSNPIACIAVASLGFNVFLMRHGYKGDSKSRGLSDLVELKNKDLDSLKSKLEESKKNNEELISNIKKEHIDEVKSLNDKIDKLKNKSHNKKPLNYPKSHAV
jgi:predicted nuclease with TOPRIM domain